MLGSFLNAVYLTFGMTSLPFFLIKGTKSLEDESNIRLRVLEDKNAELELRINSGSSYLKDQNETLLQEIKRLNSEVANLSASKLVSKK